MDSQISDPIEEQAKRLLHVSPSAIETFILLWDAFLSGKKIADVAELRVRSTDNDPDVRSRLTLLRNALVGKIFLLPDGQQQEFEIPSGQPYHLEKAKSFSHSLLWNPHTSHGEDVLIHTYERLFFRRNSFYVRDVRVNTSDEVAKVSTFLKCAASDLTPSMHYVSSGEIKGAIVLQDFFRANFTKQAVLSTGHEITSDKHNRILLGSALLETTGMVSWPHEKYRIVDGGIREGRKRSHTDKDRADRRRTVFVLMSRRQTKNGVQTVFEGSHGRAIQGLCEGLTDKDNSLCQELTTGLIERKVLPSVFQAIFKIDLITRAADFIARASRIQVDAVQPYDLESKAVGYSAGKS